MSDNVCNVTFDFSYFDADQALIDYYSPEFSTKYAAYQKDRTQRYQDLEPPFSFAIKCNTEILNYAMPPFAGVLRNLYDISDYEDLKLTKTELENYALLVMKLGIDKDGNWLMDYQKAVEFWQNLDQVMPEEIGSVLSPMDIEKISFDRAGGTNDTDKVSDSENHLWSAAGVSSLLFNNTKASSAALLLSIKSDQAITFSIVQSIELALNRIFKIRPLENRLEFLFSILARTIAKKWQSNILMQPDTDFQQYQCTVRQLECCHAKLKVLLSWSRMLLVFMIN